MSYPIERYLNIRMAYAPSIRADGQALAFLTNIVGMPQVWQVPLDPDAPYPLWPEQRTFGADRVQGAWFSPASGDRRLIFARDTGGNENAQLFLLDPDGVERNLTAGHEAAMHIFGAWVPDGSGIVFAANRREPGLFDLYVQRLDGAARLVWENDAPGYLRSMDLAPDGSRVAFARMASSFSADLLEVELESGVARRLAPAAPPARYAFPQYAGDGESLFLLTDQDADFVYLAQLQLDTGELTALDAPDWDCEYLALSPDRRRLAYCVNEGGTSRLVLRDADTGGFRHAPLRHAPGVVGFLDEVLAFAPDSSGLAFSQTSATRAPDIYYWDFARDKVRARTRSSHAGIPGPSFVAPELVRYPSFDGRDIPAWFYRPEATSDDMPVVVMVHGGPESQYRPYFNFLAEYFVHYGYAVLAPNVRGSTGYGKEYSHLDDVEKRMDSVEDLAYAARWLKTQPGIDGDRLAVYGGSYGGFMVLATLTAHPDLWAAGVNIVGISNLATFLENTSDYRRAHRAAEYGSLARDRDFLERIAPVNHLNKVRAPLMVIHGANDPRVPLSEAEQLVQALRAREVPVEFLVFDDEGHGLVKLKNKLVAFPRVVEFLAEHMG